MTWETKKANIYMEHFIQYLSNEAKDMVTKEEIARSEHVLPYYNVFKSRLLNMRHNVSAGGKVLSQSETM